MTATDAALRALAFRCAMYRVGVAADALMGGSSRAGQAHAEVCDAIDDAETADASTADIESVMRAEGLLTGGPAADARTVS